MITETFRDSQKLVKFGEQIVPFFRMIPNPEPTHRSSEPPRRAGRVLRAAAASLRGRPGRLGGTGWVANFFWKLLAKFRSFSAVSAPIFASKEAFFSIFWDLQDYLAEFSKIRQHLVTGSRFCNLVTDFLLKCWVWSGAEVCTSCRSWKMLSNAYLLAKSGFDTAENEPAKNLQNNFAKKIQNLPEFC